MQHQPLLDNPDFMADLKSDMTGSNIATKWGMHPTTATKWRRRLTAGNVNTTPVKDEIPAGESEVHNVDGSANYVRFSASAWGYEDYREFIRSTGQNPDAVTFSWGWTSNPAGGFWNKLNNVRPVGVNGGPAWPVIQPGPSHVVAPPRKAPALVGTWQTAILVADTQVGFRALDDGTSEPFHDETAINVALQIIAADNPDQLVLMGDIIDLASQGKFSQEAGFARTTQPAIDRVTLLGAQMRSATSGQIIWLEGNHDKRMQNFVEANALAAFGLRRGGMPTEWPVMSLPNLFRLDEVNILYKDAYPASHWWVNEKLRCEHGTKANSSGSTAAQYMNETPHISRAHGHTHRLEAQSKTTYDRVGKIRSVAINPGCLCRVDGAVPSVNGAIGADGRSAQVFEDWQQGVAVIRFKPAGEFFWDLVQIEDGRTVFQGQEFATTDSWPHT